MRGAHVQLRGLTGSEHEFWHSTPVPDAALGSGDRGCVQVDQHPATEAFMQCDTDRPQMAFRTDRGARCKPRGHLRQWHHADGGLGFYYLGVIVEQLLVAADLRPGRGCPLRRCPTSGCAVRSPGWRVLTAISSGLASRL